MEEDCPVRPARHKRRGSGQHEPTRASGSPRNLSFDELRKKRERFLPAQVASLWWNGLRYPFLDYVHLSTAGHLLQRYRRLHFSGEVRVVEFVRVANVFMWHQFKIFSAEGVAVACREVREGHSVGAADFGIYVVNLAREAVRRKPFGHCVCIEECSIDFLGRHTEHSVKPDSVGHQTSPFRCVVMPDDQAQLRGRRAPSWSAPQNSAHREERRGVSGRFSDVLAKRLSGEYEEFRYTDFRYGADYDDPGPWAGHSDPPRGAAREVQAR